MNRNTSQTMSHGKLRYPEDKPRKNSGGMGKKGGTESASRVCAHIGCSKSGCMLKCAVCKAVFYCTKEHQRLHWKKGGHKRHCIPPPMAAPPSATSLAASTTYLGVPVSFGSTEQPAQPAASDAATPAAGPSKQCGAATAAAAGPTKVCGACHMSKPVAAFSNSQQKKKARRRCIECSEAERSVTEAEPDVDSVNP